MFFRTSDSEFLRWKIFDILKSKMFAKSGGRPVYRNTKWQIIFLHYVEDERAWYFTEDWAKILKFEIFLIRLCKSDRTLNF